MPILHAVVLGVVQGLSEFLPISSSGHLAVVPWLFGWDELARQPELNRTFDVALHVGTFAGAFAYFRRDVWRLVRAPSRMTWLLLVATLPAVVVGGVVEALVEEYPGGELVVGVMLVVFGVVLYLADRAPATRDIESFDVRAAVLMGMAQALALQPGVSRSGVTISMGRFLHLDRYAATRISFLMSLPIIAGAGFLKGLLTVTGDGIPSDFYGAFAAGMLAAAVTGFIAVWGLLRLVRTVSFTPFVIYRVLAGLVVVSVALA